MEKEVLDKLDELIKEGRSLTSQITVRNDPFMGEYYVNENDTDYRCWHQRVETFIQAKLDCDYKVFDINEETLRKDHDTLVGKLQGFFEFGIPSRKEKEQKSPIVSVTNHNSNSQSQSQSQELVISILVDAIKEELGRKGMEDIKHIYEEHKGEPEKAKSKILDKLKGFGSDVASNIVANIITNPVIWGGF